MATKWSAKDPEDVRDYWLQFAGLIADGETLTAATVTIAADQLDVTAPYTDLTKESSSIANDDKDVVARFSGGAPGKYAIQYHVTTSTGQEFDLTKTLEVKERTA